MSLTLVLMVLGCLSALLLGFQQRFDRNTKSKSFLAILVVAVLVQFITQGMSFYLSYDARRTAQKRSDAETAVTLATYLFRNDRLSVDLSTVDYLSEYLSGYKLFKEGEYTKAEPLFHKSITAGRYVASSYYLLAYMETHIPRGGGELKKGDWTVAYNYLESAIDSDKEYGAAYYLRAVLELKGGRRKEALSDLRHSIETPYSALLCLEVSFDTQWTDLMGDAEFRRDQEECNGRYKFKK